MCADGGDIARGKLLLRQQAVHGLSIERGQLLREHFAAVDFVAAGVLQIQQAAAQIIAIGHGKMAERALPARAVKSRQHGIYAVHAGAGHQADIVLGHGAGAMWERRRHYIANGSCFQVAPLEDWTIMPVLLSGSLRRDKAT